MKQTDFARVLTEYLSIYLPGQRNVSSNTIRSYRDVMKQLLQFLHDKYRKKPEKLTFSDITHMEIKDFLQWLESEKKVCVSTRNQRLAAIHSFFRYAQSECPEILFNSQRILGISYKKYHTEPVGYLEQICMEQLLSEPDTMTLRGLRDCAILATLYDSAARVQELIDLKVSDVRLLSPAILRLTGKGNKTRIVPLMNNTKELLKIYMQKYNLFANSKQNFPLFHNSRFEKFTRPGISYILKKHYANAKDKYVNLPWEETINPHMLRHSKSIHMLESGIPLIYIRDFLGHVSITTTEIYLRAENKIKRQALEKMYPLLESENLPQWTENKKLIEWLNDLCK
jgi:site-specific recombinase XerD